MEPCFIQKFQNGLLYCFHLRDFFVCFLCKIKDTLMTTLAKFYCIYFFKKTENAFYNLLSLQYTFPTIRYVKSLWKSFLVEKII